MHSDVSGNVATCDLMRSRLYFYRNGAPDDGEHVRGGAPEPLAVTSHLQTAGSALPFPSCYQFVSFCPIIISIFGTHARISQTSFLTLVGHSCLSFN